MRGVSTFQSMDGDTFTKSSQKVALKYNVPKNHFSKQSLYLPDWYTAANWQSVKQLLTSFKTCISAKSKKKKLNSDEKIYYYFVVYHGYLQY